MFGLFESETVVSVSTSVSRVIEDRLIPNSIKTGTIKGILTGDQLVENIMEDMVSSMGTKGERMYRYGKKAYPYGLPTSRIYKSHAVEGVTKALLESQLGQLVTMEYVQYSPLNRLHWGWQTLFDSYGYNPQTNEITSLSQAKGFPVYLEQMQVMLPQAKLATLTSTAFEQWGISSAAGYTPLRPYSLATTVSHPPVGIDPMATYDYVRVSCIWKSSEGIERETILLPVVFPAEPTEFVQARYSYEVEVSRTETLLTTGILSGTTVLTINYATVTRFLTYPVGSGGYLELDSLFSTEYDDLGSFFPFGYFRFGGTPESTDPNSTECKAATKLLGCLNLDYVQLHQAIHANPQIDKVESALLMMIVPAESEDAVESRYLFDFFKAMYLRTGSIADPASAAISTSPRLVPIWKELTFAKGVKRGNMVIRDSRFTTTLGVSGIYRQILTGVIGKVGTYTSSSDIRTEQHSGVIENTDGNGVTTSTPYTWTTRTPAHYYRKQVTEQLYEEIQVTSLRMTYEVWGGHATSNLMVPLDHSITEQYALPVREHLYARSLHYVINAKQETELEWYQQEWFGTVLIVVAVVWTVFSMGSDGGSGLAAAIAAGTATLEMVLIAVLVMSAEYLAIKMVAKLFVKLLGPEFAMALAVVAAAYGMYSGYGASAGSMDSMLAQNLLSVSNSMISEVSAGYKKDLELLKKEGEEFNLFAQAKMDELEKVREEMEGSRLLSPFILFGESPTNYFNRTVHAGNIGIHGLDAIENYCSMALRLPELEQTIDFGQS